MATHSRYRTYPHLISQGSRRNHRWPIVISASPVLAPSTPHVFVGAGLLDAAGDLTELGRVRIDTSIAAMAARSKARYCMVWAPHDCTYYGNDGTSTAGVRPPEGDLEVDPYEMDPTPLRLETLRYIEIPEGCDETHICLIRHGADIVEVTPGEPILVADFTTHLEVADDPTLPFKNADGSWRLPLKIRGVQIEHVDEDALYGPIQPRRGPKRILLRAPWPDDLAKACEEIAGVPLPENTLLAAWRAIDPIAWNVLWTGVLKAA